MPRLAILLALGFLLPSHPAFALDPIPVDITDPGAWMTSSARASAKAPADSFLLYGGPGTLEGKFQTTPMAATAAPDWQGWTTRDRTDGLGIPFAGDFAKLVSRFEDLDECSGNPSPQVGFLDDGTPPSNPSWMGGGTGGSTSPNWSYGVVGDWVVNYTDGVSGGQASLDNEVLSPPIAWDLPGSADDGALGGMFVRFDTWMHLPYANGIFARLAVRSQVAGTWGSWQDAGLLLHGTPGQYIRREFDLSVLVPPEPDSVQIALGVVDLADDLGLPGNDATPSPLFDNVVVGKYDPAGPVILGREQDLFAVGFPESGQASFLTQAERDNADIRVDMARDINPGGPGIVRGDSIVVLCAPGLPQSPITSVELVYRLSLNPVFEDAIRANAPVTHPAGGYGGTDAHEGVVAGVATGNPDEWSFDLPDQDFMYPGDHLRYYIRATDSTGTAATFPADTDDFDDDGPPPIVVTCPTPGEIAEMIKDGTWWSFNAGAKPSTWTDINNPPPGIVFGGGSPPTEAGPTAAPHGAADLLAFHLAMQSLGYVPRVDYEVADVTDFGMSRGVGSAGHGGPTLDQLAPYEVIFLLGGAHDGVVLSDGSNQSGNDKADDLSILSQWKALPGPRTVIYFGDNLASGLTTTAAGQAYLSNEMGVSVVGADVSGTLGQSSPILEPSGAILGFTQDAIASAACPLRNTFDEITPTGGAVAAHQFVGTAVAASVVHDRLVMGSRKVDMTIPVGFLSLVGGNGISAGGITPRAAILDEILDFATSMSPTGTPTAVGPTPSAVVRVHPVTPNPSNPRATIRFEVSRPGPVEVTLLDVRGRVVRRLALTAFPAGDHELVWDGTDDAGVRVASGTYLVQVVTTVGVATTKMALVR